MCPNQTWKERVISMNERAIFYTNNIAEMRRLAPRPVDASQNIRKSSCMSMGSDVLLTRSFLVWSQSIITFLPSLKEPQLLPRVHLPQLCDALHLERRRLHSLLAPLRHLTFRRGLLQLSILVVGKLPNGGRGQNLLAST